MCLQRLCHLLGETTCSRGCQLGDHASLAKGGAEAQAGLLRCALPWFSILSSAENGWNYPHCVPKRGIWILGTNRVFCAFGFLGFYFNSWATPYLLNTFCFSTVTLVLRRSLLGRGTGTEWREMSVLSWPREKLVLVESSVLGKGGFEWPQDKRASWLP